MFDYAYPVCNGAQTQQFGQESPDSQFGLIKSLGNVESLISTLKFLKLKDKTGKMLNINQQAQTDISTLIFCRPVKHNLKDEKVFWVMKNKMKQKLNLDNPKGVLVLPSSYLIAIERKYINLYQI